LNLGGVDTTLKMAQQVSSERESVAANATSGKYSMLTSSKK